MTKVIMRNAPARVHYLRGAPAIDYVRPYIPPARRRRQTRIERIGSAFATAAAWVFAALCTSLLGGSLGLAIGWVIK